VLLNIKDLEAEFIHKLGHLFYDNKGDNQVSFEIMELEKVKKLVETVPEIDENEEAIFDEDQDDSDAPDEAPVKVAQVTEVEEIKVTKVTMPSRKLKLRFQMSCFMSLRKCKLISN
jgi:DNA polymerase-3 subunit alpha